MKNYRLSLLLALSSALLPLPAIRAADTPSAPPPPPAGEHRERHGEFGDRMADELGLSAEQKTKMKAINQAERAEMQALSPEDRKTKGMEIHAKYREQRQAVMTPEQRAKADKMRDHFEKRRERREHREDNAEKGAEKSAQ